MQLRGLEKKKAVESSYSSPKFDYYKIKSTQAPFHYDSRNELGVSTRHARDLCYINNDETVPTAVETHKQ